MPMRVLRAKSLALAVLVAVCVPVTTSGCFGSFQLTRKIYEFNRDLSSDRWVRWFGFLAMSFFLVYPVAGIIDLAFANSIEFWGGSNPFAAIDGKTRYAYGPNGEIAAATLVAPGEIDVVLTSADGQVQHLRIVREPESLIAYDGEGQLLARIGDVDGVPTLLEGAAD